MLDIGHCLDKLLRTYIVNQHPQMKLPRFSISEIRDANVPMVLWSLWDKGVENAPPMQKACLASHGAANPSFNVTHLDLQSATAITKVLDFIPSR